jgi:hypothetical protein
MNAPATTSSPAKGNALKTFAVNFILAFAGYITYQAGKEYVQARQQEKTTKP